MENTTDYRVVTEAEEAREYLDGAKVIAFDFETAPRAEWREDALAALDAHKADIVGVSFSVAPGTGILIQSARRQGRTICKTANTGKPSDSWFPQRLLLSLRPDQQTPRRHGTGPERAEI